VIHLDTSFLIRSLEVHSPQGNQTRAWVSSKIVLRVSAVCWAEFLCGPFEPSRILPLLDVFGEPIPFTAPDAEQASKLFNSTRRRRGSLADCMIAAIAIREGAHLATTNASDFARFQRFGLTLAKF